MNKNEFEEIPSLLEKMKSTWKKINLTKPKNVKLDKTDQQTIKEAFIAAANYTELQKLRMQAYELFIDKDGWSKDKHQSIYDKKLRGSAVGVDLGFLYKLNDFVQFGGVVQNLNAKYKWKTNAIFDETGTIYYEDFPVIYRAGIKTRNENFQVLCDVEIITNNSLLLEKRLNGGIEYYLNENVKLRSGFGEERFGIGFGYTYFDLGDYGVTLDYSAVMDEAQKFNGVTHVISSSFSF